MMSVLVFELGCFAVARKDEHKINNTLSFGEGWGEVYLYTVKHTLLYIMDPLCGWCYGFSGVMQELQGKYKDTLVFKVIPGGMITGERVAPVAAMANYILGAYKRVEEYTGALFGEPYLDMLRAGTEISNSEPPCRAIHTFSAQYPERALDFTHQLQLKIFRDGKSWNEESTYRELAVYFGIDADKFIQDMDTEENRYGTHKGISQ
jgi:putative protein-disulfide isomerase